MVHARGAGGVGLARALHIKMVKNADEQPKCRARGGKHTAAQGKKRFRRSRFWFIDLSVRASFTWDCKWDYTPSMCYGEKVEEAGERHAFHSAALKKNRRRFAFVKGFWCFKNTCRLHRFVLRAREYFTSGSF